jgi:hypothetical protein
VLAPVDPVVTAVADRIGYDGATMIVTRGDRFSQVRLARAPAPNALASTYVAIAPILRDLGDVVTYDPLLRVLTITTPDARVVALPTPFNPAVPEARPSVVFTPQPVSTPRPVFTGRPVPRRTPVPLSSMTGATPRPGS